MTKLYLDILYNAGVSTLKEIDPLLKPVLTKISNIIDGKVITKNDRYFIEKSNGSTISFDMEAEGIKKFGLIYRLIETGCIAKDSILLWDELDSNLNPKLIRDLVEIVLELSKCGIQIFITTHSYNVMRYFHILSEENEVLFTSLYKENGYTNYEQSQNYDNIENNAITDALIQLTKDGFEGIFNER